MTGPRVSVTLNEFSECSVVTLYTKSETANNNNVALVTSILCSLLREGKVIIFKEIMISVHFAQHFENNAIIQTV